MAPLAALFTLSLVISSFAAPAADLQARSPNNSKKVIASLFDWNWVSVTKECPFLASAGYGYVQVSTAMEHIAGPQWWTDYQAVSYKIQNKRGNRVQFKTMMDTCHQYGVKVIVDVIFNHMAGIDGGVGVAGTTFSHFQYSIYDYESFHHCGLTPGDEIVDFNNEAQVERCMLDNLADLDTESPDVRKKIALHANDLISLGADGLRVDAAKHVSPASMNVLVSMLSKNVYITQEVVDSTGRFVNLHEAAGDIQEFRFAYNLLSAFSSEGIASLNNIGHGGLLPSNKANVFVANHDTERGGSSLSYKSPSNEYTLAHIFLLSYGYGTPTVHSGFSFTNTDQGPNNAFATCGNKPTDGWECQHRWPAIVNMVPFANAVGTSALTNMMTSGNNQIAYGRGSIGHVALNNAGVLWHTTLKTSLPSGSYCDIISGHKSNGKCTGATIQVRHGNFIAIVNAHDAIAIYTGAKL